MAPLSPQDQLRQRKRRGRKPGIQPDAGRIAALLDERGYVPARVAEAAGCTRSTFSNIKNGNVTRVSRALLGAIAGVLEVDVEEITLAAEPERPAAA